MVEIRRSAPVLALSMPVHHLDLHHSHPRPLDQPQVIRRAAHRSVMLDPDRQVSQALHRRSRRCRSYHLRPHQLVSAKPAPQELHRHPVLERLLLRLPVPALVAWLDLAFCPVASSAIAPRPP